MALSQEALKRLKKSQQMQEAGNTGTEAPKTTQQKVDANIQRKEDRKITPERQRQIEEAQRRANQAAQTQKRSQKEISQLKKVTKDVKADPLLAGMTRGDRDAEILRRKEQEKAGFASTAKAEQQAAVRDQYGRQLDSGYAQRTGITREGELFEGYRQKSIDQQKAGMGAMPERPTLPEDATYEDRLKAEAEYNKGLADYYQGELGASQEELGTVSGQVTSLADQITQNQDQIDQLINTISAKDPQKGQQTQEAITEIAQMGLEGQITPEAISQVSALIDQGIEPRAAIKQAFGVGAPAPAMDTYAPAAAAPAFTAPEIKTPNAPMEAPQVIPSKEPEPFKPDGSIVNTQFGVSLNGNTYSTPSGLEIPRNVNTGFPDYNSLSPEVASNLSSYDLFAIDVATGQFQMASQNADLQAFYTADMLKKTNDRILRDSKTYYDQIESTFDPAENKINQEKVFALQEQELAAQRLEIEKDMSIQSLNDGHAKNEAIMKAMVDAYGLEGSSAQLAIMGNLDLKYRQQLSQTKKAYAVEGAQIALNSSKIRFDFANQLVELTNSKNNAITTARNELTDRLDEADSMRLASQIERTQARNAAYQELATKKGKIVQDAQARETEAQKEAMDRMFEIQTEGIKASGYIPTIGPDGTPSYMMDENGQPIDSLDAKKLYAQMDRDSKKLTTNEFGEPILVDLNDGSITSLGKTNPNNNFPYNGVASEGDYTIGYGDAQFSPGDKYTGQGECVGGARVFCKDLPYNLYTINDKRRIYSGLKSFEGMQPGDSVTFNGGAVVTNPNSGEKGKSGHQAVIESIDFENKTVRVVDANYNGDNRWGVRKFSFDQIDRDPNTGNIGIFRPQNPIVPQINGSIGDEYTSKFSDGQKFLMDSMDPTKVDDKTLRRNGLTEQDYFDYKASSKGKLNPQKRSEFTSILDATDFIIGKGDNIIDGVTGSWRYTPFSGEKYDVKIEFEALKDRITLPNLENLKGAMSDNDIKFIRNASTSLALEMSEPRFKEMIAKTDSKIRKAVNVSEGRPAWHLDTSKYSIVMGENGYPVFDIKEKIGVVDLYRMYEMVEPDAKYSYNDIKKQVKEYNKLISK